MALVEERVREEKEKAAREKKEAQDQLKFHKNELKVLTEKLARLMYMYNVIVCDR